MGSIATCGQKQPNKPTRTTKQSAQSHAMAHEIMCECSRRRGARATRHAPSAAGPCGQGPKTRQHHPNRTCMYHCRHTRWRRAVNTSTQRDRQLAHAVEFRSCLKKHACTTNYHAPSGRSDLLGGGDQLLVVGSGAHHNRLASGAARCHGAANHLLEAHGGLHVDDSCGCDCRQRKGKDIDSNCET